MAKFISYGRQSIDQDDIDEVVETLKSDFLTQGPKIEEFEKALCKFTGAKYAIALANGTAALHLAVAALDIKEGSEGITTPNTFAASANCLAYCRLKPVFADIDEATYNINPDEIKKRITAKTKVIVAVDFAGQPADMRKIFSLAKKNKIKLIEDASHAIGSRYATGEKVGSCKYSDMTTFSFHPVKTITTAEGGAITTNNKQLYERLILLRTHGITKQESKLSINPGPWYYEMQELGFNYRLSDIQAALGVSQLKKLNKFTQTRRKIIKIYNQNFEDLPFIKTPFEADGVKSTFHLYVICIDFKQLKKSRAQVMAELREEGIGTQVHYIPVHLQPYYKKTFGYKEGDFPICEDYYESALSLPLFAGMTDEDVSRVVSAVRKICR